MRLIEVLNMTEGRAALLTAYACEYSENALRDVETRMAHMARDIINALNDRPVHYDPIILIAADADDDQLYEPEEEDEEEDGTDEIEC